MEGFLGWLTKVVDDWLNWGFGVLSSAVNEGGLPPQVMGFGIGSYAISAGLWRFRGFPS